MGPFDGILGFSQGASVLGYFLIHPSYNIPVQFAIFAARSSIRPHLRHLYGRKRITSKAIFMSKPPVGQIFQHKNHAIPHRQPIAQFHTANRLPKPLSRFKQNRHSDIARLWGDGRRLSYEGE